MRLTSRAARQSDFQSAYRACFPHDLGDEKLKQILAHEWQVFLAHAATRSMVAEDLNRPAGDRIVGFAQTVFVTDKCVGEILACDAPLGNVIASHHLRDGSWPLLSIKEIAEANAGEGLNALVTRLDWTDQGLTEEEQWELRGYIEQSWARYWRGYNYRRVLLYAYGPWPQTTLTNSGFHTLADFTEYFRRHPPGPPAERRPVLMGITRDEGVAEEGSLASQIFRYSAPRFGFTLGEQELLTLSLDGLTDADIVENLNGQITLNGIKKRWSSIFDRVDGVDPYLLPAGATAGRGEEKRRPLLAYLREHYEELRPFSPPAHASTTVRRSLSTVIGCAAASATAEP